MDTAKTGGAVDHYILDALDDLVSEARRQLADLMISGLTSVPEGMIAAMERTAERMTQCGLELGGAELMNVASQLEQRRHRTEFDDLPVIGAMVRLEIYLAACGEKLSFDRARGELTS